MMRFSLAVMLLATALSGYVRAAAGDQGVVLLEKGGKPAPIAFRKDVPRYVYLAADLLDRHLQQMVGMDVLQERLVADAAVPTPAIVLEPLLPADEAQASDPRFLDSYSIHTEAGRIHVRGGGLSGMRYGIYALLEEVLGCRFYAWDEQEIPRVDRLVCSPVNLHWQPAMVMHDLYNREAQSGKDDFRYKVRSTSLVRFTGNHTLHPLLDKYAADHAEILPMNEKGERRGNKIHFCYMAPGIAEALAEAMEAVVQKYEGNVTDYIYFAGMGDWYGGMCLCELCRPVYEDEAWTDADGVRKPGYTATLLRMINRTAELLEAKYPGIRVGTFAYMSIEAPPLNTVPRHNVVIQVPRLRHCTVHSVEHCEKNRSFELNLQRWCEIAPGRVYVWDYGVNFINFMYPFPCVKPIADNLKLYHRMGIAGVSVQGNYVSMGSDMVVLKNYVWGQLLRDPSKDTDELIREFCEDYYGPGAADALAYLRILESLVNEPKAIHASEFDAPHATYLTAEAIDRLDVPLVRALESVQEEPYRRRMLELRAGVEAARLWLPGTLVEKDGWLIREDIGENTFGRAQELLKHIRDGSPREWGSGRRYHQGFLMWHGGPVATISRGNLTVKVAPNMSGRVGPIELNGHVVIRETIDVPEGGVLVAAFEGEPTTSIVATVGEVGVGHWSPDAKYLAYRTTTLPEINVVRLVSSLKGASVGAAESTTSRINTVYPWSNDGGKVDYRDAAGRWHPMDIPADGRPATVAEMTSWRITLGKPQVVVIDQMGTDELSRKSLPFQGELKFDAKAGSLTTSSTVDVAGIGSEAPTQYLTRDLRISSRR